MGGGYCRRPRIDLGKFQAHPASGGTEAQVSNEWRKELRVGDLAPETNASINLLSGLDGLTTPTYFQYYDDTEKEVTDWLGQYHQPCHETIGKSRPANAHRVGNKRKTLTNNHFKGNVS